MEQHMKDSKNVYIRLAGVVTIWMIAGMAVLAGCKLSESDGTKVADLDYTVVEEAKVPEELKEHIDRKKEADFKLTYEDDGQLYIVRGYGEQETGGYSIAVKAVYLTKNTICFHTMLIGPGEAEEKTKAPSYPYIVVQVKSQDKNVIFE